MSSSALTRSWRRHTPSLFADVNEKLNELIGIIDDVYKPLKRFVDETEKSVKEQEIQNYALKEAEKLGELGRKLVESPSFFNKDWLLKIQ